jgi:hypothetical protein
MMRSRCVNIARNTVPALTNSRREGLTALTALNERNRDLATFDPRTSSVLRKTFRVFEQLGDVVNDIVNWAAANDALRLEGKSPFNQLLHSFEVHYPIRFPRFTTVGRFCLLPVT